VADEPAPKFLFGLSSLSPPVGLPEYGLLRGEKLFLSPDDAPSLKLLLGLSSPLVGLPEYGFDLPDDFLSPDEALSLKLLLGLSSLNLLLWNDLSGLDSFFFSPSGVALPFAVAGLFGLSSPLELLPVDFPGLSSRLPVGLLNTIFFCLALSQREGQSYAFLAQFNQKK
jgi:hypothetical protein